ncbi:MAG: hypothetical protein JWN32_1925 [Solirubrobacterales bacterium]|nr:hypothetical protein [Solirubrobacterales bacterium]
MHAPWSRAPTCLRPSRGRQGFDWTPEPPARCSATDRERAREWVLRVLGDHANQRSRGADRLAAQLDGTVFDVGGQQAAAVAGDRGLAQRRPQRVGRRASGAPAEALPAETSARGTAMTTSSSRSSALCVTARRMKPVPRATSTRCGTARVDQQGRGRSACLELGHDQGTPSRTRVETWPASEASSTASTARPQHDPGAQHLPGQARPAVEQGLRRGRDRQGPGTERRQRRDRETQGAARPPRSGPRRRGDLGTRAVPARGRGGRDSRRDLRDRDAARREADKRAHGAAARAGGGRPGGRRVLGWQTSTWSCSASSCDGRPNYRRSREGLVAAAR